jgi:paraquat-inducible protein B
VTSEIYLDAVQRLGLRDQAPQKGEEFIHPLLRMQLVSAGITGVRFLQTDFFHPGRYPEPILPFEPPWNYIPSAPSTLKSVGDSAMDVVNRLPDLETRISETLLTMNTTLGTINRFVSTLQDENGSFDRLLVQLRGTAAGLGDAVDGLGTTVEEAKLADTTTAIRTAAGNVADAATGFNEIREDLQASLGTLRETLDSFRSVADSLERDPSILLRGPRADGAPPRVTK